MQKRIRSDGPIASTAAGSVGIGMEDDADAGHRLVEFWQMHRDVVGNKWSGRADMDETRWIDVETSAGVRRADFQKVNGMEFKFLATGVQPQALFGDPLSNSAVRR